MTREGYTYVERVSSRPYWRKNPEKPAKRAMIHRKRVTCEMCDSYPCFKGIESIKTNLALTCHKYKRTIKK